MKDKKILLYLPAKLVKGNNRWYILYYQTDPNTGDFKRFRPTYNLNRIKDIQLRIRTANGYISQINKLLPTGYPFQNDEPHYQSVAKALDFFETNKYPAICEESVRPYKRLVGDIKEFLKKNKLEKLAIGDFSELNALEVMAFIKEKRNISNNSYNRYLKDAIVLFNFLKKYKFLTDNPFLAVSKKRKTPATYRKLLKEEIRAICNYIETIDYYLYLAILLQYYCFIRPIELTRLKFSYFDLLQGTITLPAHVTKSNKIRTVTIPVCILPFFRCQKFAENNYNYFVFGNLLQPSAKAINKELMYKRFRRYIKEMHEKKLLDNIDDIVFYSFKKTGISDAYAAGIKGEFIRLQAGHSTESITQIYNQSNLINEGIKDFVGF